MGGLSTGVGTRPFTRSPAHSLAGGYLNKHRSMLSRLRAALDTDSQSTHSMRERERERDGLPLRVQRHTCHLNLWRMESAV